MNQRLHSCSIQPEYEHEDRKGRSFKGDNYLTYSFSFSWATNFGKNVNTFKLLMTLTLVKLGSHTFKFYDHNNKINMTVAFVLCL